MVERICPQCQRGNPLDNRFCGQCGAPLERPALESSQSMSLATTDTMPLRLQQVGRAVVVSVAALAAEAGLLWLRRRVEHLRQQHAQPAATLSSPLSRGTAEQPVATHHSAPTAEVQHVRGRPTTIFRQRVIEVWEHGVLTRQTVDKSVWRREDG